MRYATLGQIPAKRHVQVRRNGDGSPLLVEEVMGYEGFSGNETILYHLHSPCRLDSVGGFRPLEREEWVPDAHVHRLADTVPVEPGGDPLGGREHCVAGVLRPEDHGVPRLLEDLSHKPLVRAIEALEDDGAVR